MSDFEFYGNMTVNQGQFGDNNRMFTNQQNEYVNFDWEIISKEFQQKKNMFMDTDSKLQLFRSAETCILKKDQKNLTSLIKRNLPIFCDKIFCHFAAPALIEIIKLLLD